MDEGAWVELDALAVDEADAVDEDEEDGGAGSMWFRTIHSACGLRTDAGLVSPSCMGVGLARAGGGNGDTIWCGYSTKRRAQMASTFERVFDGCMAIAVRALHCVCSRPLYLAFGLASRVDAVALRP